MKYQTKVILGGLMGNIAEAYDLSICYFLAIELNKHLLGNHNGSPTVLLSLIFLAYLAKPLGALFLGLLSDLYGRKRVLIASLGIMGLATSLIALVPEYRQIGWAAPLLFLLLRILQSMALGSEFLNSASFMVESGQPTQRGFRGCWPSVGVKAGYLLALLIVESIRHAVSPVLFDAWLWRVPFAMALLTTLVGVFIRRRMPESLDYVLYYAKHPKPTAQSIYAQSKRFIRAYPFLMSYAFFTTFLSVTTGFFFYLYIPLHAIHHAHLARSAIMLSTVASLIAVTVLIPVFGWLSDKRDRITLLTAATAAIMILAYPFMLAVNTGDIRFLLSMQLLISVPCACYYSVASVILTELFPLPIRCTALSLVFSLAASLASGIPPLLADWLTQKTPWPTSPACLLIVPACIFLIHILYLLKHYRIGSNQYSIVFHEENTLVPTHSVPYPGN